MTGAVREILKEREKAGAAWNTSMFTENLKSIVGIEERLKAIATSAKAEEAEKAKPPPPKSKAMQRAEQSTLTFGVVSLCFDAELFGLWVGILGFGLIISKWVP